MNGTYDNALKKLMDGEFAPLSHLTGNPANSGDVCAATSDKAKEYFKNSPGKVALIFQNEATLERFFKEIPEVAWDLFEASDKHIIVELEGANQMPYGDDYVGCIITTDQKISNIIGRVKAPLMIVGGAIKTRIRLSVKGQVKIIAG
jgi:hypothetical protein